MSHAKLSPSGAHRWINCTKAPELESQFPDKGSVYAQEGTLAHSICEAKLKAFLSNTDVSPTWTEDEIYDPEMEGYTDQYVEFVEENYNPKFNTLSIEQRVNMDRWVNGCFGTADCIIAGFDSMHIVDFKYGKNVAVSPVQNEQMMLYALGCLDAYEGVFEPEEITMTIVQPRKDSIESWTIQTSELLFWAETVLKPKAKEADENKGIAVPGDHCIFCKAKSVCKAYMDQYWLEADEIEAVKKHDLLTPDEVGKYLTQLEGVKTAYEALKDYALEETLQGHEIPGFKAVEGRSIRQWTNQEEAFKKAIESGIDEAMLYERKPVTLTTVEKMMGKKPFSEVLGDYVDKPQGKPTLVPESDKRPPFKRKVDEFDGITI